jgi:NAD(P)-dependent dehydrogenase (short-subunit alcohol dehydrogenase family)
MDSIFIGGAEGFLGRHCALHYLKLGKAVAASCWKQALGEELKSWLGQQGADLTKLHLLTANLSNESEVAKMVASAVAKHPRISHVVNCVGAFEWVKVTEATRDQVEFLFQANFHSNWLVMKYWGPLLAKQTKGRIALISAAASTGPAAAGMGIYCASKAALNCIIHAANQEWKDTGVVVGAVYPTIIDTPRNRADMPTADFKQWMPVSQVIQKIDRILTE